MAEDGIVKKCIIWGNSKKNTDKMYIALVQIWIFEVVQYST